MLKKTSLFLCFLMFFMTTAQASTTSGLKQLVDEFNYGVQVEWDQKDKDFYNNEVKKFETALLKLQEQGLTAQEMMSFLEKEIKDPNVVKALKDSMTQIDMNKLDRETSKNILMKNMEHAYTKGANWNGTAVVIGTYIAIIAVIAVIAVVIAATSKGPGNSSGGSSSGGSYDDDDDTDSSWNDWNTGGSGGYDYSDDYDYDYGTGNSGSGGPDTGGGYDIPDSDGDGWGDDWDWREAPTF